MSIVNPRNDEAVSPVLGAILMLAVGVTLLTTVQLSFVPVWNTQEELDHLKKMQDDFKVLKSGIESSVQSGTALSFALSMGFKYSPKMFVYNPRESAYATLSIQNNTWAEVRYNEILPDGTVSSAATRKNISTSTITYALQGAQNYNAFIYEHGLIRRRGSNYTASSQTLIANSTLYLLAVKPLGGETSTGVEKRTVNIYPTSQQKNSVIGENVWLILHTRPDYVNAWRSSIENEVNGEENAVKIADSTSGIVIAYINRSIIKMGEAYISTAQVAAPAHAPPCRIVKVTPENINLPVGGTTAIAVEVQDCYNNPVPNVRVDFSINTQKLPTNACAPGGCSLQGERTVTGADGRANVALKTSGGGRYYIDASLTGTNYTATFVYSVSSQSGFLNLDYTEALPEYIVTATLRDGNGEPDPTKNLMYAASNGTLIPSAGTTNAFGMNTTVLNTSSAAGISVTNVRVSGVTNSSAIITWDTIDTVTVTANRTPGGYIFSSIDVPTKVNSTGCVRYGTQPDVYTIESCTSQELYSHNFTLSDLNYSTVYYFIVNSTRPGGMNANSSEYMLVTEGTGDSVPPASVTGLSVDGTGPLYIRWVWTDPDDIDFNHVNVYIDGSYAGAASKGQQYFNGTYFRPNTSHTISLRTEDDSGYVNATWTNLSGYTPSVYAYVFNFTAATGAVTSFDSAKNDADGGASALFNETYVPAAGPWNNYSNVTSNYTTYGSISNWQNMRTDSDGGAYANLTEEGSGGGGGTTNALANAINTTDDNTLDLLADLQANDTSGGAPGGGAVQGDGWYTVDKNKVMDIDGFDTSGISGAITAATLKMQYSVEAGYSGTNAIQWGRQGAALNSTGITPANGEVDVLKSYNLYAQGIDTASEISTLNIRFASNDGGSASEVAFDYVWVEVTYSGSTTYSMNITTYIDPVPLDTDYYLEIRYRTDANETYDVFVFDGTVYTNRTSLNSGTWAISNITLSNLERNNGNVSVRYLDQNPSGANRGNLSIDYQRVHGYTPQTTTGYDLDIQTNTTDVPEANRNDLQIKYNVTGDSFSLWLWNRTSLDWNNKTVLDGVQPYYNVTLLADELIPYQTIAGSAYPMTFSYVLARYQGQSSSEGRLYIDYQRVNSS